MSDRLAELIDRLDADLSALNGTPCRLVPEEDPCLQPRPGEGPAFRDMRPDRMCAECAAYWHLAMALDRLRRVRALRAQDEERTR